MIILSEKIFGLLGFAYHRTREVGLKNILNNKFIPGGGAMYGKGAYLTYELESQLNSNMVSNYGEYIVKFKVNLDKVLIFDKDIQKIVYGKEMKIIDQISYFKLGKYFDDKIQDYFFDYSTKFTSVGAKDFYNNFKFIPKILNGILFTGHNDGLVLVMYNTNNMYPVSYCFSDKNKLNEKDLEWQKSLDKNLFKDYMLSVTSGTKDVLQYYDKYEKKDNFIGVLKNNKWGLLDKNFNEILKIIYDHINLDYLDINVIKIELNKKYGLLDKNFNEILEPIYNDIDLNFSRNGFIVLNLSNKVGFLSSDFKKIVKPIYDNVVFNYASNGFLFVKINSKYGIVDKDLKEIVKPIYDRIDVNYAQEFIFLNLFLGLNLKTGVFTLDGKEIVKPIYDRIIIINSNTFEVFLNDKSEIINI